MIRQSIINNTQRIKTHNTQEHYKRATQNMTHKTQSDDMRQGILKSLDLKHTDTLCINVDTNHKIRYTIYSV